MEEKLISGYCCVCNAARTVLVDREEQTADCSYPTCEHCAESHRGANSCFFGAERKKLTTVFCCMDCFVGQNVV